MCNQCGRNKCIFELMTEELRYASRQQDRLFLMLHTAFGTPEGDPYVISEAMPTPFTNSLTQKKIMQPSKLTALNVTQTAAGLAIVRIFHESYQGGSIDLFQALTAANGMATYGGAEAMLPAGSSLVLQSSVAQTVMTLNAIIKPIEEITDWMKTKLRN